VTFPILDWHVNDRVRDASDHLGRVPLLFNPDCADPAWQQLQDNYPGGYQPEAPGKWTLTGDEHLIHPGLPPCPPSAMAYLRSEQLLVYAGGWLAIVQPDGEYTLARVMP
jgi:hypothetical protein